VRPHDNVQNLTPAEAHTQRTQGAEAGACQLAMDLTYCARVYNDALSKGMRGLSRL